MTTTSLSSRHLPLQREGTGNWEQGPPLRATVRSFHRVGRQVLPKPRATHPVTQQSPARRSQPQNDSSATAKGICGGTVYPDFLFPRGCPYQLLKPRNLKQQAPTLPCLWRLEVGSQWHWAKVKDHVRPPRITSRFFLCLVAAKGPCLWSSWHAQVLPRAELTGKTFMETV